ncbi:MAG: NUDIX domain-containing protein [Candidatus Latescibacterota bacterium]
MAEDEILAIFDPSGRRVGAKPRGLVHRDGDWHWAVWVWAAQRDAAGRVRVLLQVRGRPDDPYAGSLDALAGGHVAAVESHLEGALREFGEEVGIRLRGDELIYLGQRFLDNPTGVCRRVIEHFYLCRRPVDLRDTAFGEECSGFVEVDLEELDELLNGGREDLVGQGRLPAEPDTVQPVTLSGDHLAAYSPEILESCRRSLRAIRAYLDTGQVDRGIWA